MNTKELYNELMLLCSNAGPFFFKDQELDGETFRIFSYHFIDHEAWRSSPVAVECRGITFHLPSKELVCRPVHKFFNIGEPIGYTYKGPAKMMMDKVDGSLISSFRHPKTGKIHVKSKTSISSEYAKLAQKIVDSSPFVYSFLDGLERMGYTVNLELVSPDPKFRVVIFYDQTKLVLLNARHRESGEYADFSTLVDLFNYGHRLSGYFPAIALVDLQQGDSLVDHDLLKEEREVEGHIMIDQNDRWWKLKTSWYLERHRAKDFIKRPKTLIQLMIKEESDDVMSMFSDQPELLNELTVLEKAVFHLVNSLISRVNEFYQANKDLSRKDFAIKGKQVLSKPEFPMVMMLYSSCGEEPDWKPYLLKQTDEILLRIHSYSPDNLIFKKGALNNDED